MATRQDGMNEQRAAQLGRAARRALMPTVAIATAIATFIVGALILRAFG
jgi:hypothetical protein